VFDRLTSRRVKMLAPEAPLARPISLAACLPKALTELEFWIGALNAVPPTIPVNFVGDPALLPVWLAEMVLLALAAPVFALSINFLRNPCFLGFGVVKPPSPPVVLLFTSSQPTADLAPCLES
jgi:hypothetical protein